MVISCRSSWARHIIRSSYKRHMRDYTTKKRTTRTGNRQECIFGIPDNRVLCGGGPRRIVVVVRSSKMSEFLETQHRQYLYTIGLKREISAQLLNKHDMLFPRLTLLDVLPEREILLDSFSIRHICFLYPIIQQNIISSTTTDEAFGKGKVDLLSYTRLSRLLNS